MFYLLPSGVTSPPSWDFRFLSRRLPVRIPECKRFPFLRTSLSLASCSGAALCMKPPHSRRTPSLTNWNLFRLMFTRVCFHLLLCICGCVCAREGLADNGWPFSSPGPSENMVGQRLIGVDESPVFNDIELIPGPAPRACSALFPRRRGPLQ